MRTIINLSRNGRRWCTHGRMTEPGGLVAVFVWDTGNVLLWSSWIRHVSHTLKRTWKERSMMNWPVAETSDSNAWSWPVESCNWLARCTWHCHSWSEKSSVKITLYINFCPKLHMTSCRKCSSTYERGLIFSVAEQRVSNLFLQGAEVVWMVSIPQRFPADTCRGPTLLLEPGS